MNAFIHEGRCLQIPAPYEVHGGDPIAVGALFGIAISWSPAGEPVDVLTTGIFDLRKPADETWQVGDRLYWNDERRELTTQEEGNRFVGVAVEQTRASSPGMGRAKITGIAA